MIHSGKQETINRSYPESGAEKMSLKIVSQADVKQSWNGKLKFHYRCPTCNEELVSTNEEIMGEESCPNCDQMQTIQLQEWTI